MQLWDSSLPVENNFVTAWSMQQKWIKEEEDEWTIMFIGHHYPRAQAAAGRSANCRRGTASSMMCHKQNGSMHKSSEVIYNRDDKTKNNLDTLTKMKMKWWSSCCCLLHSWCMIFLICVICPTLSLGIDDVTHNLAIEGFNFNQCWLPILFQFAPWKADFTLKRNMKKFPLGGDKQQFSLSPSRWLGGVQRVESVDISSSGRVTPPQSGDNGSEGWRILTYVTLSSSRNCGSSDRREGWKRQSSTKPIR